ncbi:hypothetical protein Golomagni_01423 [Golovinomyces magnicellulatus]|nr:hypothetical protein Golomagni_01423 [Golovinomyces magnicellulatus]
MSLSPEFQSDKILFSKLLQAYRSHPSCSIACSTVADKNIATLKNRLRSNIATWKTQQNPMRGNSSFRMTKTKLPLLPQKQY